MSELYDFKVEDHIGILTLKHPPVNSFVEEMRVGISEIFEDLNNRVDVYCVIINAEGKGFSGGQDLNEMLYQRKMNINIAVTVSRITEAVYNCRVPIIAAVHGYVVGLGFAVASLCDIIIASEDAYFSFPEINVGTVGGPFWFKRIVPDKRARYYFYTAKKVPVEEMYRFGAVLKITKREELMDEAMAIAKEICTSYPPSVWATKQVIIEGEKEVQDVVDVSDRMRYRGNRELLAGDPNKGEMIKAKLEHRKPNYNLDFYLNNNK